MSAYRLKRKLCNSRKNSNGAVIPDGMFSEKAMPSEAQPFSPFAGRTKIFCSNCLDCQCQASSRGKAKNLPVFCLLKRMNVTVSLLLLL